MVENLENITINSINMGADSSNLITQYNDKFAAIWGWNNKLFINTITLQGEFENKELLKIYDMQHGERIVSFIQHEDDLIVGIDGMKSCKLLFCNLEKNCQKIFEYKEHSLIEIFSQDTSLIIVTHNWENKPKVVIYIGVLNNIKRIISIDDIISAPFCMKIDEKIIISWNDKNNILKIQLIDINKNTIKNFDSESLQILHCYTVGSYDKNNIYIGGFIPNIGTNICIFDYDLNLIENYIIKTDSPSGPNMFTHKIPVISIEPYDDNYIVQFYNLNRSKDSDYNVPLETIENCISPNFAVNKKEDVAMMLYISKGSLLKTKLLNFRFEDFNII
jgi:hypothetical protein